MGVAWKEEWNKMYPDLKVEWRTVISRYNYHFGGLDGQDNSLASRESISDSSMDNSVDSNKMKHDVPNGSASPENSSIPNGSMAVAANDLDNNSLASAIVEELHDSLDDSNARSNVKGFRNWTNKAKQELVETKNKIIQEHPNMEQGSSEFNHLLLREFIKLNPKCMESSRSIYSKLQSIEKAVNISSDSSNLSRSSASDVAEDNKINKCILDPVVCKNASLASAKSVELQSQPHSPISEPLVFKSDTKSSLANMCNTQPSNNTNFNITDGESIKYKPFENSTIEGFQDWTLGMIRDFIACMDTARRRHAELRENQPNEQVKLVPLLLEEWRNMYPKSKETVKTFLVKIKYLKLNKDVIKKHLVGGSSSDPDKGEEVVGQKEENFKWHRDMIQDVIDSRRLALEIKDKALAEGRKLSFHALWASEFRRVYPNSTFTSNNLSVHFWTWRKQLKKKKVVIKKPTTGTEISNSEIPVSYNSNNSELSKESKAYNAPGPWSKLYKKQLLEVGRKVEQMLQEKGTPNEVKLEGFANILHMEWRKVQKATNGTKQDVSARAINMMYSRLLRENDPGLHSTNTSVGHQQISINTDDSFEDLDSRITATWTPKHNRVLRECMEGKFSDADKQDGPISHRVFTDRIIKQWRNFFPKSSISDDDLSRRISDSMFNQEAAFASSEANETIGKEMSSDVKTDNLKDEKIILDSSSTSTLTGSQTNITSSQEDTSQLPNEKGQMIWNKQAIIDLFKAHFEATKDSKIKEVHTRNISKAVSFLLHKYFTKSYPHCRLSTAILFAKYYKLKEEFIAGKLGISLPAFLETNSDASSSHKVEEGMTSQENQPNGEAHVHYPFSSISNLNGELQHSLHTDSSPMPKKLKAVRDLVFRTWTQEMIDDMLKTRKIAISKKKKRSEKNPYDPITITDLWYDEFLKYHPDYKSTKKNLWRKYKWYTSRIKDLPEHQSECIEVHDSINLYMINHKNKVGADQPSIAAGTSLPIHDEKPFTKQEIEDESIKLKPIRKDVFHFIKAVLEESRIFLPMKLPEESIFKHREKGNCENTATISGKTPTSNLPSQINVNRENDQHSSSKCTTFPSMLNTNEYSSDFPSNLNVPNLPCLSVNDVQAVSPPTLKLRQMFAPSQSLVNTVQKLPASVTVTPQAVESISDRDQSGIRNTSGSKRSSIKLPGNMLSPV